jgi:acylphosphatase
MDANNLSRLHAIVEGHVQGVGFRVFVQTIAITLGLKGWVRNLWDGNVEVTAEGAQVVLEKFLASLIQGPRGRMSSTSTASGCRQPVNSSASKYAPPPKSSLTVH